MVATTPLSKLCGGCKPKAKPLLDRLKHKITIEQQATTYDSVGQQSLTWSTLATVMAAVEPLQGREFFSADQYNSEVKTRIRIRYRSDVTAGMRVSYDSHIFNIHAVINPQWAKEELQLMCGEGLNNG